MTFNSERRQRFISKEHFNDHKGWLEKLNESARHYLAGDNGELSSEAIGNFLWGLASESLEALILRYTAGIPIDDLRVEFPPIIDAFDVFISQEERKPNEAATLEITQLEAYVYVMWLLALAKLLGHDEQIPRIMQWINKNAEFNRYRDGLFEAVVQKLTDETGKIERLLLHPDVYRPLAKATVLTPEEAPALVKDFLDGWYKQMKPCYWHGTHTDKEGSSYFGYWAFEAALVTYLWDIDDSSYREHLVYPKDLVDFARTLDATSSADMPPSINRCEANQPCPQPGYWYTPAQQNSRTLFKQGDVMPNFPDSSYGATIWYWDQNQD